MVSGFETLPIKALLLYIQGIINSESSEIHVKTVVQNNQLVITNQNTVSLFVQFKDTSTSFNCSTSFEHINVEFLLFEYKDLIHIDLLSVKNNKNIKFLIIFFDANYENNHLLLESGKKIFTITKSKV